MIFDKLQEDKGIENLAENTVVISVNLADQHVSSQLDCGEEIRPHRPSENNLERKPSHISIIGNETRDGIAKVSDYLYT